MSPCRVLVLGGSSGIGLAIASLVAGDSDVDLHATAPTAEAAADAQAALGPRVTVHVVDLTEVTDETLRSLTEAVDVLILSAGLEYAGPIEFEPTGALQQMLAVNVHGPATAAACCLPGMIERDRGLIIGLGSIVAAAPRPFLAGYAATKAAFASYLAALAAEVSHTNVQVEHLALPPVATDLGANGPTNWSPDPTSGYHAGFLDAREFAEQERHELQRTPTDVAEEVLGLVRSFRSSERAGRAPRPQHRHPGR